MARYTIAVEGDDLSDAMAALEGAGIRTMAISHAQWGEGPPAEWFRVRAILDASTSSEAVTRVRDTLPQDREYVVGRAERLGPITWITDLRVRAMPDPVGSLTAVLNELGSAEVSAADEQGIYDLRVEARGERMHDVDRAIALWNLEHPGQILKPA